MAVACAWAAGCEVALAMAVAAACALPDASACTVGAA